MHVGDYFKNEKINEMVVLNSCGLEAKDEKQSYLLINDYFDVWKNLTPCALSKK